MHQRLKIALRIRDGDINGDHKLVDNYLHIIAESDLFEKLVLPTDDRTTLSILGGEGFDHLFEVQSPKKRVMSVALIGPAMDLTDLDADRYDLYVFNKPPSNTVIPSDKIILILNNIWPLSNMNALEAWLRGHPKAHVLSPTGTPFGLSRNAKFDRIPRFPFNSSLMGLQRALFILNNMFDIDHLEITGFNFSLSTAPYKQWYPTINIKDDVTHTAGILRSIRKHDFLLNYMYTRKILRRMKSVSGEVKDLCDMDVGIIIKRFEILYGDVLK